MSAQPIVGSGPSNQSIYEVKTSQAHPIGTRGYLPDGRVFFYTLNDTAAALNVGQVIVASDIVANHQNVATATNSLAVGASVVRDVTLGATAAAADLYKDGYLAVTDAGGQGQTFQLRSHDLVGSGGTGDFPIYGSVAVASDASTTVSLFRNLYAGPQISQTNQQDVVVGIPTTTIPVGSSAAQYGWLQTWGPAAVLFGAAIGTVGQAVVPDTSVQGAVEEDNTATTVSQEPIVGYTMSIGVDTEYQMVDLRIRP